MILTLAKTFLGKYALTLLIVGILLAGGGAIVWMQKWANDKCTASINEAIAEAEIQAKKDRAKITTRMLRQRRAYEDLISDIRGEAMAAANDNPVCIQPASIVRMRNAVAAGVAPGPVDGGTEEIRTVTGDPPAAVTDH